MRGLIAGLMIAVTVVAGAVAQQPDPPRVTVELRRVPVSDPEALRRFDQWYEALEFARFAISAIARDGAGPAGDRLTHLNHLELRRRPDGAPMSVAEIEHHMAAERILQVMLAQVRVDPGDRRVLNNRIFFGDLPGVPAARHVQLTLEAAGSNFEQAADTVNGAILFALAMDAERRTQRPDVICKLLSEARLRLAGIGVAAPDLRKTVEEGRSRNGCR
jgi:hypothetical protein